ncbi:hypothetical protein Hanom_Chr02g00168261 [Helianthus anomalus]
MHLGVHDFRFLIYCDDMLLIHVYGLHLIFAILGILVGIWKNYWRYEELK